LTDEVVDVCQGLATAIRGLRASEPQAESGLQRIDAVLGYDNAANLLAQIRDIAEVEGSMSSGMTTYLKFDLDEMMREHGATEEVDGRTETSENADVGRFLQAFCEMYEKCVSALLLGVQRTKVQDDVEAENGKQAPTDAPGRGGSKEGVHHGDTNEDGSEDPSGVHAIQSHQLESMDGLQLRNVAGIIAKMLCAVEWGASQAQAATATGGVLLPNIENKWTFVVSIVSSMLLDIEPLLTRVFELGHAMFVESLILYKGLGKLQYVTFCIFRTLLAHGFCRSKEEEADGDGNVDDMQFEDDVEGTGMGEGDGKKDVSDEIDDEEQLLGLKGDEEKAESKPEEKKEPDDMDKGLDMENEFEGETFDVDKDEQEQDDGEEGKEDEMEREMGDLDEQDEDVVDEKMWGDDDDDDKETPSAEEKFEENSAMQGEALEDEMHTKEEDEDEAGSKDKEDEPKPAPTEKEEDAAKEGENEDEKGGDDDNENENPDEDKDPFNNDDNVEESHGFDPMQDEDGSVEGDDENEKEDEDFDLPEKMELDGDDGDKNDGESDVENEDTTEEPLTTGEEIDMEQDADEANDGEVCNGYNCGGGGGGGGVETYE
jgi:hypothetical protein